MSTATLEAPKTGEHPGVVRRKTQAALRAEWAKRKAEYDYKFTYRLLEGCHQDRDPATQEVDPETGRLDNSTGEERYFDARDNNMIKTDQALHRLNGGGAMRPKFELLVEGHTMTQVASPMDRQKGETAKEYAQRLAGVQAKLQKEAYAEDAANLDKMNVAQLTQYAAEEELDVKGVSGQAALLKAIKGQLGL